MLSTKGTVCSLLTIFLATILLPQQTQGFVTPFQVTNNHQLSDKDRIKTHQNPVFKVPRGGDSETALKMAPLSSVNSVIQNTLFPALQSGPYGVLAITAVAATAVVPLTLYRQLYSISVGYGMAIFLAGLSLQLAFQPAVFSMGQAFTGALCFYGIRLASYLLLREQTRKTPSPSARKESSIVQKLTLASSVSLFYALLSAPAMYALRSMPTSTTGLLISQGGLGLAIFGAILEAVADLQKYIVKQSSGGSSGEEGGKDQFIGPTRFCYSLCRHPNYLGEVLFWAGIFVAGAPSFGTSIIAWAASSLGLYGIVSIMTKATARLEGQHQEKYGGQEKYDTWAKKVKAPLVPFF